MAVAQVRRGLGGAMTATPAVIGLSAGNRLLTTSFGPTDLMTDKVNLAGGGDALQFAPPAPATPKLTAVAQAHRLKLSPHGRAQVMRALRHHSSAAPAALLPPPPPTPHPPPSPTPSRADADLEALVLLQRSMLEKQWELPFDDEDHASDDDEGGNGYPIAIGLAEVDAASRDVIVARSAVSARQRRMSGRRRGRAKNGGGGAAHFAVSPELMQSRNRIYLRGTVSKELLTHKQVVHLSHKIKDGIWLQQQRSKLKEKLGNDPSYKQLAHSLKISPPELRSRMRESFLAREMLTMSNIRLVISIAQKYDNLGVELADLIQGGLIGLLRGIEKFDASKGFRISTYVYWWIRQGVSRALADNSKTFRLPTYLHERLIAIRSTKYTLEDQGIAPTIENIAESLNISEKKVLNATEAVNKVLSLDQQAFPSLNGLPGETLHSYIEDQNVANDPWHGFEEWYLKDEVNKLLNSTLNERERDIIRLYHGIGKQCHTWEDISRQFGLSRERVRQVGLIAMEKLKHAARRKHLDALLEDH
uniref:RNA polymerase sigma-70 domain-containing protein n=2 Tax=Leersia perrieri TaxID=77586 RepID=A0A0D9X4Q9_9ORYZ